ncbi:transcription elongation factor A N-terminal and central domain-containing protein [Melanotaenia boesemani]|uniref:transcription elongation factor A N-terminal and central domain-containing protein n=1 Tax=Melanotaenia boesemani TaxID=1250792 RepID=UPI001C057C33|nr:transcription elongation factor A N-terminal and central domain-containing protein [Melanotaenia boesemani]XP_041835306.1 transcription elongation factor A N-terminal and central domain-containing protein [Melanotaenia boesemani]XP_041835307.1 transcription elongation factor A N-terminal and central domain-containing protein [Melanotaenia boesemani]
MDAKEIVHCALQIEKFTTDRSYGNIMTLLDDLEKSHVTAEQLETTDIVKALYRLLKTCADNNLRKTVKNLLSKWKKQYSKDRRGVKCSDGSKDTKLCSATEIGDGGIFKQGNSQSGSSQASNTGEERETAALQNHTPTAERIMASSDSVRTKCVQLLLAALCLKPCDQDNRADLAENIEHHIHELHRTNQVKYKRCIRSKVANLRNPKNSHLRQGLLSGSLLPEVFARMSAEEMANAELRQLREEYSSQGVSERQLPQGVEGTQTQKIRCKRCEGSDCRVKQMSRGALFLPAWVRRGGPDEDAMTFVTCNGCGQQWYHSGWICL